jgi:hypothetical protein
MRSPYKAKRPHNTLKPRDAVFLHPGTSYADKGLYPVPKACRGRLWNWSHCTIVDATSIMGISVNCELEPSSRTFLP